MSGQHPNATIAAIASGIAALIAWLLRSQHVDINAEQSALIAGVIAAAVLFVGRRGIKGTLNAVWQGTHTAWSGKPSGARR